MCTHTLVLSQLMKQLVRCPMCWTDGSLPVHWIARNRQAHSSAAMIVLMDGDNIQSAVESSRTRVDECICLCWTGYACVFILTLVCVCLRFAADFSFTTTASHRRPFEFINPQIRNVYVCPTWLSITDCFSFYVFNKHYVFLLWFYGSYIAFFYSTWAPSLIYTIQMETFNEVMKRLGASSTSSDCFWNTSWLK